MTTAADQHPHLHRERHSSACRAGSQPVRPFPHHAACCRHGATLPCRARGVLRSATDPSSTSRPHRLARPTRLRRVRLWAQGRPTFIENGGESRIRPRALDEFAVLQRTCVGAGMELVLVMSPGLDWRAGDPADVDALVAKFRAFYDIGVRTFSVNWDDVPGEGPEIGAEHGDARRCRSVTAVRRRRPLDVVPGRLPRSPSRARTCTPSPLRCPLTSASSGPARRSSPLTSTGSERLPSSPLSTAPCTSARTIRSTTSSCPRCSTSARIPGATSAPPTALAVCS